MGFECVVYKYLGVYCPGCGGTRAVEALFHGDILQSIYYHPFVVYVVAGMLLRLSSLAIGKTKHKQPVGREKFYIVFFSIGLGIILVNCLVRNILLLCLEIKLI